MQKRYSEIYIYKIANHCNIIKEDNEIKIFNINSEDDNRNYFITKKLEAVYHIDFFEANKFDETLKDIIETYKYKIKDNLTKTVNEHYDDVVDLDYIIETIKDDNTIYLKLKHEENNNDNPIYVIEYPNEEHFIV